MVKTIGYCLFALIYYLCLPFPIIRRRVFCIASHDEGEGSNVNITAQALKELDQGYTFSHLTKSLIRSVEHPNGIQALLRFFFLKPYELARAEVVLLDNIFLPYAYLHRRKAQKVIQLWHGTGTIKKFGQDVNTGRLKKLEEKANSNVTHLIVNSEDMKKLYSGSFGIPERYIYSIGLPKTDELLKRVQKVETIGKNTDKEILYKKYKIPADKKLILYAPTFRDHQDESRKVLEFINILSRELSNDYYIGLRLHPHIAENFKLEASEVSSWEKICQMSGEKDLNSLLMACDLLITDYSSIIFEYCLRTKPMLFYAYDYEEFSDRGRGFYYEYESYVPGPVVYTEKDAIEVIKANAFDSNRVIEFANSNYTFTDGKATTRLIELIKK